MKISGSVQLTSFNGPLHIFSRWFRGRNGGLLPFVMRFCLWAEEKSAELRHLYFCHFPGQQHWAGACRLRALWGPEPSAWSINPFLQLVECLASASCLCWCTVPATQAPQPLERPLSRVESTVPVSFWPQVQWLLWKRGWSQHVFSCLEPTAH